MYPQDGLPAHVKALVADAKTKKEEMDIISNIMVKKRGRWEINEAHPSFKQTNTRNDRDFNEYKHLGRARLIVENELPGGAVASMM